MSTRSGSDRHGRRWRSRFSATLLPLLRGGASLHHLAAALALGATIGLMPLVWGTSLLCLAAALLLRLNPAVVELANLAVYPLQISLFLPYLRLGERCFGAGAAPGAAPLSWRLLAADPFAALGRLLQASGSALLAWAVTAWFLLPLLYLFARYLLRILAAGGRSQNPARESRIQNGIQTLR